MDHFPWQSQGVLRLRFSEKAICHSITTYHPYSGAIEIFPSPWYSPLPDHGVVLDHWIYSFWGLLFGALQIRLIRRKESPLFQSSDSHVAMAVFFRVQTPDSPVPNEQWWVGDSGEFTPFHSGSWSLVWGAICCLWHRTARVLRRKKSRHCVRHRNGLPGKQHTKHHLRLGSSWVYHPFKKCMSLWGSSMQWKSSIWTNKWVLYTTYMN